MKKIVEGVEATAAKISEIAAATVQQAGNAEEVSRAVQGIAQVTEQSAAGSEEMASSSEELGAQAQALRELVSKFSTGPEPSESSRDLAMADLPGSGGLARGKTWRLCRRNPVGLQRRVDRTIRRPANRFTSTDCAGCHPPSGWTM